MNMDRLGDDGFMRLMWDVNLTFIPLLLMEMYPIDSAEQVKRDGRDDGWNAELGAMVYTDCQESITSIIFSRERHEHTG